MGVNFQVISETLIYKNQKRKCHIKSVNKGITISIKRKTRHQCTYNVTLRRFLATIAAVEKQQVLHNLSVCL